MKVVEPDDQRGVARHDLDRLRQLAEHAALRHPHGLTLERPQLGRRDDRGHLHEPRGRVPAKQPDGGLAVPLPAEARDGLQEREIGFADAVVLDASAMGDGRSGAPRQIRKERLDERRLADTGLPGDEDHPSLARPRPLEGATELLQLSVAPDHELGASQHDGRGRRREILAGRRVQASDEPVAAPVSRLDEARAPGVILQRLAQLPDTGRERGLSDDGIAPHGREQLLARHGLSRAADQDGQHGGGLRGEPDLALAGPQPPGPGIEPVTPEGNLASHHVLRRPSARRRRLRKISRLSHDFQRSHGYY
ncbi:MAG TPA: hypothetical protein VG370_15390 [Chloroflexota bacterium]|nr:hypothetical protein [Chloroflexota bacterium]